MRDWIRLNEDDLQKLDPGRTETQDGVEIHLFMSPYDVPQAVRGSYDQTLDRFVIEFKYIGDEPIEKDRVDDCMTLRVGKNSRRLYGLEVNIRALKADHVRLNVHQLEQTLNRVAQIPTSDLRKENIRAAGEAISLKQDELFSSLAPA